MILVKLFLMSKRGQIELIGEALTKYVGQKVFYIGTEVEQYRNIFNYKWDFPLLTKLSYQFVDMLKAGKSVLIFGQTEPAENTEGKLVQRPIINVVISDHQLQRFSAACTSVQSTDAELVKLSSYEASTRWCLVGKDRIEGTKNNNLYYIRVIEAPSLAKIESHKHDNLTQYFTYSNFFIDCQESYDVLYKKVVQDADTTTFEMEYQGEKHEVSIETDIIDDKKELEYWAKYFYLKYWEKRPDFNSIPDISKVDVKPEIVKAFSDAYIKHGKMERKRYQEQKEEAKRLVEEAEPRDFQIYKCYGHCPEAKLQDLFSPVINRFLGKAVQYE